MFELVKKILDTAKDNNVDVGVAYDYVANEMGYTLNLAAAKEFLNDEYDIITALRNADRETDIKVICDMKEQGNDDGLKTFIKSLKV